MENEEPNYIALGLTDEESDKAEILMGDLLSDLDDISDGEILNKLLNEEELKFNEKLYMAYMFGRTRDKWEEFQNVSADAK